MFKMEKISDLVGLFALVLLISHNWWGCLFIKKKVLQPRSPSLNLGHCKWSLYIKHMFASMAPICYRQFLPTLFRIFGRLIQEKHRAQSGGRLLKVRCVPTRQACPLTHSSGVNAHDCEAGETYSFSSPFIPHMTIPLRLMMVTQKAEEAKILFLIIFAVFWKVWLKYKVLCKIR